MIEAIDYSTYALASTCRAKYYYRIHRKLVPRERRTSAALLWGTAFHAALDHLHRCMLEGKPVVADEVKQAFLNVFTPDMEDTKHTQGMGLAILDSYMEKWLPESFVVLQVETGFRVPLTDSLDWYGKMDTIVVREKVIYVMENKTSSKMYQQSRPNYQLVGYAYAAQEHYPDNTLGSILNTIGKFKKFEPDKHLLRDYHEVKDWEIEEWRADVLRTVEDLHRCEEVGVWPRNTGQCSWGAYCEYRDVCAAAPDFREKLIESIYVEKEWEPFQKLNGEATG